MDSETGKIRMLKEKEQPKKNEVLFEVGEIIEIKGCNFKIRSIGSRMMTIEGIPKIKKFGDRQ